MKEKIRKLISILITIAGLCLLFYPWISDYVNQRASDSIVDTYNEDVKNASEDEKNALIKEAEEYNATLLDGQIKLTEPFEESVIDTRPYIYEKMLSLNGSDVMGKVEIPKIDVSLPIYHGTSTEVLEKGVGHLKGSSLPVGGINTHCVLTGHTGLSNARLFTDLTELKKDDIFILSIMDMKLAYKVVDIWVVLPEDTSKLKVVEGKDYCTLVTCTPYGVNSHRLFVRGERTEYREEDAKPIHRYNPTKSLWMRSYAIAVAIGLAIVLVLFIIITLIKRRRKKRAQNNKRTSVNNPDRDRGSDAGGTGGK